jgi:hypothetical protein
MSTPFLIENKGCYFLRIGKATGKVNKMKTGWNHFLRDIMSIKGLIQDRTIETLFNLYKMKIEAHLTINQPSHLLDFQQEPHTLIIIKQISNHQ